MLRAVARWLDSEAGSTPTEQALEKEVDWLRILPFVILHVACLGIIWVGWSWAALAVAAGLYLVRMFAITAFYHRYFSHRAYKAGRFATSPTGLTRPAGSGSSFSPLSEIHRPNGALSGGPLITGTTTATQTRKRMSIPRSGTASGGPT